MIHVTVPSITMKLFRSQEDHDNQEPYIAGLQWQLVELDDGTVMATSACWHGEFGAMKRADHLEAMQILYSKYNVRRVRTRRPKRKWVPRWRRITEGAYSGFSELRLPDDFDLLSK